MGRAIRRIVGALASVGAAALLVGGPMVYAVHRPSVAADVTPIINSGISVWALNPSDDIHEVTGSVDPTNHQISSAHPNTTADFVIELMGIASGGGNNFTAPITASWKTSGNPVTVFFSPESGTVSFPNRYAQHYQFVKIPVRWNSTLAHDSVGTYESFNLVITGVTNATIGRGTATVYIVNGVHGPNLP